MFLELVILELNHEKWGFQWGEMVVKNKTGQRIKQRQGGERVWLIVEMVCMARR